MKQLSQFSNSLLYLRNADPISLKVLMAGIPATKLKEMVKCGVTSLRNRSVLDKFSVKCVVCGEHDVNREDGEEVCKSCLMD